MPTWRFGAFAAQGWKTELAGIDGAAAQWQRCLDTALTAEELGYDSIWVYDHFHNVPTPAHEAVFECWTTMAALGPLTSRVRLGLMVGANTFRNPGLTAKLATTLDHVSGGRAVLGIGGAWFDREHDAFGIDFGATPGMGGDFARALGSIRAQVLLMPSRTDQYFLAADVEAEGRLIPGSRLVVIPSTFGHTAGGGADPAANPLINRTVGEFLDSLDVTAPAR